MEESILRKGDEQVAAGYIMYGTSTILVYSAGDGVHTFVLDEEIGEFVLDHDNLRMPEQGKLISSNFGNYNRWVPAAREFMDAVAGTRKTDTVCAIPAPSWPICIRFCIGAASISIPRTTNAQRQIEIAL